MFSKIFTFSLSICIAFIFTAMSFGQSFPFWNDFESFTVGEQLACQDPVNWTTWSNLPCDPAEDAYISDNYAFSGTKSVAIVHNTDLIKPFGTLTSGKWDIFFRIYIPSGKQGNIYVKSEFTSTTENNAMAVFFKLDGTANLNVTPTNSTPFTYAQDEWLYIKIIVDLDYDNAEFWCGEDSINSWQWTIEGDPLQLICANFWGINYLYEMYIDNFEFDQNPITSVEDEQIPIEYSLHQNYPNPFNPTTTIKYQIPELSFVSLKVFDVLGSEVITLVNEEKPTGTYEVGFDATSLPSGVYFYRLQSGSFVETKKMVLMK